MRIEDIQFWRFKSDDEGDEDYYDEENEYYTIGNVYWIIPDKQEQECYHIAANKGMKKLERDINTPLNRIFCVHWNDDWGKLEDCFTRIR